MTGDDASIVLMLVGALAAMACAEFDRPRLGLIVGVLFCAPVIVRLWIAAVAS
jgi:hypothetical protein